MQQNLNDLSPAARLADFIERDALVRNEWGDGYKRACLLAAMVPECATSSDGPAACPAEVMPLWMAYLTPKFDDNGTAEAWPGMVRRFAAVAGRWHALDVLAWGRVRLRFLRGTVTEVRSHVAPEQTEVFAAIDGVLAWLDAGAPEADLLRVQKAAIAARRNAWDRYHKACGDWRAAAVAEAAARAAEATVAEAVAEAVARAAEAAAEARAAAWDRITALTLSAIEAECDSAEAALL